MTDDTATTERAATSQLIAWCRDCKVWVGPEDIGIRCDMMPCERTYIKRRALICSVEWCRMAFFDRKDFKEHVCGSAY